MRSACFGALLCWLAWALAGCAASSPSLQGEQGSGEPPRLLPAGTMISEVRTIAVTGAGSSDGEALSEKVFRLVGARLKQQTEQRLKLARRWQPDGDVIVHLETEQIRLRKSAAVLLLSPVAGPDEMRVKVWVTRGGRVIAQEIVATQFDAGGIYSMMSPARRLNTLADQIASKVVKRRL